MEAFLNKEAQLLHFSSKSFHFELYRSGRSDFSLHLWFFNLGLHIFTKKSPYAHRIEFDRLSKGSLIT